MDIGQLLQDRPASLVFLIKNYLAGTSSHLTRFAQNWKLTIVHLLETTMSVMADVNKLFSVRTDFLLYNLAGVAVVVWP